MRHMFQNGTVNVGAKVCRKKVTGVDWKVKEIQNRYKDHFSPLINKRIDSISK